MAQHPARLPDVYPDGTKYVVESAARRGYVHRFVEFPDGRITDLPNSSVGSASSRESHTSKS